MLWQDGVLISVTTISDPNRDSRGTRWGIICKGDSVRKYLDQIIDRHGVPAGAWQSDQSAEYGIMNAIAMKKSVVIIAHAMVGWMACGNYR